MNGIDEREALIQELRARSQDVGGHPLDVQSVTRKARVIQRRRHLAAGAMAAAVLGVAVPALIVLANGVDGRGKQQPADGPTPRPTASASPSPTSNPRGEVPLTTLGVTAGARSAVTILNPLFFAKADGSGTLSPAGLYATMTPYQAGWLAVGLRDGMPVNVVLQADGSVTGTTPGGGLAVSSDGGRVAFVRLAEGGTEKNPAGGELRLESRSGAPLSTWPVPPGAALRPVGILGDGSVVYATRGAEPAAGIARSGARLEPIPGLVGAGGVSSAAALVSGQTSVSDGGSCWTVMALGDLSRLWDTCAFSLGQFSPDGRRVLGTSAAGDGVGGGEVAVLDAQSGELLVHYVRTEGDLFVASVVWEDDSHLLATVHEDGEWSVVRLDLSGNVERVLGPVRGVDEGTPAYRFAVRP